MKKEYAYYIPQTNEIITYCQKNLKKFYRFEEGDSDKWSLVDSVYLGPI